MQRLELRPKARADLRSIWRYSKTFSYDAAINYYNGLVSTLENLRHSPRLARHVTGRLNMRMIKYERHFIFFESLESSVVVVQILHERMNFGQHL